MPYEFNRFSTQSFERFIQAIAVAIGGYRAQVFGAGRDGAREATIEGGASFLDQTADGYVVFQAKYLARSSGFAKDLSWTKRQIDLELAKYADSRRGLRRPDTYIFATNVRLSGAAADVDGKGQGGVDAATEYLRTEAASLNIETVHLWHADTLSSLIDAHPSLKTSFSTWIEPSDVLATLLQSFRAPNQHDTLIRYLRRSIQHSRDIKTRDAGQTLARTIGVSEVFVDLPVAVGADDLEHRFLNNIEGHDYDDDGAWIEHYVDLDEENSRRLRAVYYLLGRASDRFANGENDQVQSKRARKSNNKVLILAGPGQGKSTVSQFTSQVYRATILSLFRSSNTAEVNSIIDSVQARMRIEGINDQLAVRIPLHVDLPRFADEMQRSLRGGESLSIFAYIAKLIESATDAKVDSPLLQSWLVESPAIFVLDGLDEVPASGGREGVIDAIHQLDDFIMELNLDAMVVVTSRPQGYQDELSRKHWNYWTLEELNVEEAISVASALAPVLISDTVRQEEVLELLSSAANDDATAALMTSPLQVTLLFNLVASHNNIPKDRWTLFLRHYETLRDREIAKGGTTGRIIGEFKNQIDRLHYDAGFILHVKSEQPGAANAYFTEAEFSDLILDRLAADGFEGELATSTARSLAVISTDRLVFLRSGIEGQIAFDVRSLQEFMAAARITLSPESQVIPRLAAVAGKAHWLHVTKIAVSRIYGSTGIEALRDSLLALLDAINAGDNGEEKRVVRLGAQLAIALLADGAALTVPLYRRRLFQRALSIYDTADQEAPVVLARLVDAVTKPVAEGEFLQILNHGAGKRANVIRTLIARSIDSNFDADWFTDLIMAAALTPVDDALTIIDEGYLLPQSGLLASWFIDCQRKAGPAACLKWLNGILDDSVEISDQTRELFIIQPSGYLKSAHLLEAAGLEAEEGQSVIVTYRGLAPLYYVNTDLVANDDAWKAVTLLNDFQQAPSREKLSTLIALGRDDPDFQSLEGLPLPWIVALIVDRRDRSRPIDDDIKAIMDGVYGSAADWAAAEERWSEKGILLVDIAASMEGLGWLSSVATIGAPAPVGRRVGKISDNFASLIEGLIQGTPKDGWITRTLLSIWRRGLGRPNMQLLISLKPTTESSKRLLLEALLVAYSNDSKNLALLNAIVRSVGTTSVSPILYRLPITKIVEAIEGGDSRSELIDLMGRFAISRAGRSDRDRLLDRVIEAFSVQRLNWPKTAAAAYVILASKPAIADVSSCADQLMNERRFYMSSLDALGKASSHPNQVAVAKKIALRLLIDGGEGDQSAAYSALTTDINSKVSAFSDPEVLQRLNLPCKAAIVS